MNAQQQTPAPLPVVKIFYTSWDGGTKIPIHATLTAARIKSKCEGYKRPVLLDEFRLTQEQAEAIFKAHRLMLCSTDLQEIMSYVSQPFYRKSARRKPL